METFEAHITVERLQLEDVVHGCLLAILFQREYQTTEPSELQVCDVTLAIPLDADTHRIVREHAERFANGRPFGGQERGSAAQAEISLEFCERVSRKSWFARNEEQVPWERWTLTFHSLAGQTERERVQISKQTTADLRTFVLALTRFVNTKRAHVPLMTEEADVGGAGGEGGTGKGKGYWGWRVLAGRGE